MNQKRLRLLIMIVRSGSGPAVLGGEDSDSEEREAEDRLEKKEKTMLLS